MFHDPKEGEWRWFGGRAFWILALIGSIALIVVLRQTRHGITSPDVVPVVSLVAPTRLPSLTSLTDKSSQTTVPVWVLVRDVKRGPLPGIKVNVSLADKGIVATGTTDAAGQFSGSVSIPAANVSSSVLLKASAKVGKLEGADSVTLYRTSDPSRRLFVSTDKPVYQPGQTIHIRALALGTDGKPLAKKPSSIEVSVTSTTSDSQGSQVTKVFKETRESSAFGIVSADFELADQVKLGSYQINATIGDVSNTARVEVKRYALPKIKVSLDDLVELGPKVRGKVRASWVFGEPVTNVPVSVAIRSTSSASAFDGSKPIVTKGKTGADGAFAFELQQEQPPTDPLRSARRYSQQQQQQVVATVDAEDGSTIEAMHLLSGGRSLFMDVVPEAGMLRPGMTNVIYVATSNADRSPAPAHVQVLGSGPEADTSRETGVARLEVRVPEAAKTIDIVATTSGAANDTKGGARKESQSIEVAPNPESVLIVRSDHHVYPIGAKAKVTVLGHPGALGDAPVALHATRDRAVIASGSCAPRNGSCEGDLTFSERASGLVWIHATSSKARGQRLARIEGVGDLSVQASIEKPAEKPVEKPNAKKDAAAAAAAAAVAAGLFTPGSTVDLNLVAKDARGGAVPAAFGLSVVDESVFLIANVDPSLEKKFFTTDAAVSTQVHEATNDSDARAAPRRANNTTNAVVLDSSGPVWSDDDLTGARLAVFSNNSVMAVGRVELDYQGMLLHAKAVQDEALSHANGWLMLLPLALAMILFVVFLIYTIGRIRRPDPIDDANETELLQWRVLTQPLVVLWVLLIFVPMIGGALAAYGVDSLRRPGHYDHGRAFYALLVVWALLAIILSLLLVRTVGRVRGTAVATAFPAMRRVLWVVPAIGFLCHAVVLAMISDEARALRRLFGGDRALIVPVVVFLLVQLTFGLISYHRQTAFRTMTTGARVWLLISRPIFVGLPVAFLFVGAVFTTYRSAKSSAVPDVAMAPPPSSTGGARPPVDDSTLGATGPRVRDDFPETLLWMPEIVSSPDGRSQVKVPLADSITTWRASISAVSAEGQFGSTTLPIVVKQDFFVDVTLPPVLTQGDEISIPVTVFSYLDTKQDVRVEAVGRLEMPNGDGLTLVGPAKEQTLVLAPKDVKTIRFIMRADRAGELRFRVKAARLGSFGDAVERKVIVEPKGMPIIQTQSGRLSKAAGGAAGSGKILVELPEGAIVGGNDLYVKVYEGALGQVAEGLDGVFQMPHGCFEQTSSTTYPSILALDFLRRTRTPSPQLEAKAVGYINQGYQRLLSFEVSGGGFDWFGNAPANTILSAFGLAELSDMARVSNVDPEVIARTRKWIYGEQTKDGKWRAPQRGVHSAVGTTGAGTPADDLLATTYIAWALAQSGDTKDPRLIRALDHIAKTTEPSADDDYVLALRSLALLTAGRADDARLLVDKLTQKAIREDGGAGIPIARWSAAKGQQSAMYSSGSALDVELTALVIHALALAKASPELREAAIPWLASRRDSRGTWSTTQNTIAAMRALLDSAKPLSDKPGDELVTVSVDGAKATEITIKADARGVHHLRSLRDKATTGKHEIELAMTSEAELAYQVVSVHYLPWDRRAVAALAAKDVPMKLDVTYAPETLKPGVMMHARATVKWTRPEPAQMPLVEIGIPPSFDVVTDDLDKLVTSKAIARYTMSRTKVTLYLSSLSVESPPTTFDLRMRATHPARVVAPASAAYPYYEPDARAETAVTTIRVTP